MIRGVDTTFKSRILVQEGLIMDTELIPRPIPSDEEERGPILSPAERHLLWAAVCEAARQLNGRPRVCLRRSTTPIRPSDSVPTVKDWQLAEALALLCVLLRAGAVHAQSVGLFAKLPAVTIGERGRKLHLWFQPETRSHVTNLRAKPDIAVTFRPDCDAIGGNIQRVIEVKHVRQLRTVSVRQEFAKAFDLSVCSYCLLTYYHIPPHISTGANNFGLDAAELFIAPGKTPAELGVSRLRKAGTESKRRTVHPRLKTGYGEKRREQPYFPTNSVALGAPQRKSGGHGVFVQHLFSARFPQNHWKITRVCRRHPSLSVL
jgi:hypothetical protein